MAVRKRESSSNDLIFAGAQLNSALGAATRQDARLALAGRALEQDDPAGWLKEMLDILDLRER